MNFPLGGGCWSFRTFSVGFLLFRSESGCRRRWRNDPVTFHRFPTGKLFNFFRTDGTRGSGFHLKFYVGPTIGPLLVPATLEMCKLKQANKSVKTNWNNIN